MESELTKTTEKIRNQIHPFRIKSPNDARGMNELIRRRISALIEDEQACNIVRNQLSIIARESDFINAFTESGIFSGAGLLSEIFRRISLSLIPEVYPANDFRTFIKCIFFRKNDYKWIFSFDDETRDLLWYVLNKEDMLRRVLLPSVANALVVLSHRIASLGLENELADKMPEIDKLDSPFIRQSEFVIQFASILEKAETSIQPTDALYNDVLQVLTDCNHIIETLRAKRNEFGASFALSLILVRLKQMIIRMRWLLDLTVQDEKKNRDTFFLLFTEIIKAENIRYSVLYYLGKNTDLIAYQVTEHASKTGSHYITSDKIGYWKLFRDSLKGGVFVGFMAFFKVLIALISLSPFGYAFMYSLNYAAGFVGMHLTHSALATKQPAVTAQALASSLDKDKSGQRSFANQIAQIFRSQFISFVGNLIVVFPLGAAIGFIYDLIMPSPLVTDEKAMILLNEIHPLLSRSFLYAAIAGFYLFLSGLVAGYVENMVIYAVLKDRIISHPFLSRWISPNRLQRIGRFFERNAGGIAGNTFFGLCMGSTAIFGHFFGLDLDVRHITFAGANTGIALAHFTFNIPITTLFVALSGTFMIGFINFFVSFSLSFILAVKARSISLVGYKELILETWQLFKSNPRYFLFPPSSVQDRKANTTSD